MKFRLDFKDPNALDLYKVANDVLFADKDEEWMEAFGNLNAIQRKEALEDVRLSIQEFLEQWMRHHEYITVEFNTDTKTAMVVPTMSL
jgi:hypothetical protein